MLKDNGFYSGSLATVLAGQFTSGAADYTVPGIGPISGAGQAGPDEWWSEMLDGQERFLQQVLGGYTRMEGGFGDMLEGFLDSGNATFAQLAGNLARMGANLLGGLNQSSGILGGIAGSVSSALGFLGPVGSVLSTGFSLFKGIKSLFGGRKTQHLASPLVSVDDYRSSSSTSTPVSQSNKTVNVYINGQSLSSAVEVDRTLGRAGVDRSLRDQIKELVRSGANPVA